MRTTLPTAMAITGLLYTSASVAAVDEYNFQAWIDDRVVGNHQFTVTKSGEATTVAANARFSIKLLFVKLFDYEHTVEEHWQGDCLISVDAMTTSNGKTNNISGSKEQDAANLAREFVLTTDDGDRQPLPDSSCTGTFAYWDLKKITKPSLLNPQTGELLDASLEKVEASTIPNTNIVATSYRLNTEMGAIQLWYGADEEWLALQSKVNKRTLTYVAEQLLNAEI